MPKEKPARKAKTFLDKGKQTSYYCRENSVAKTSGTTLNTGRAKGVCVGIPGKVVKVEGRMATVEVGGATREIALDLVSGVVPGDYIIAHAGFAIHKVDEEEARKTLQIINELTGSIENYDAAF